MSISVGAADGFHEPAFNEREQAEIIALAAALQREQAQRATLSDLERAAVEAGIEPRFVREAVRQRAAGRGPVVLAASYERREPVWHASLVAALFVPAEIAVLHNWTLFFRHGPGAILAGGVIALFFGLALPRRTTARRIAGCWPMLIALFFMAIDGGGVHHFRIDLVWLAAVQGAIAVIAHLVRERRDTQAFGY